MHAQTQHITHITCAHTTRAHITHARMHTHHTRTVEYCSVIKKNENVAICSNVDRLGEH